MILFSGSVIYLFTDIEGPTSLAQDHLDKMTALLKQGHEKLHILEQAFSRVLEK